MEGRVRRVFQLGLGESFMVVHGPVSDKLDLGDAGNGLQVGVKNGFLGFASLVVSVTVRFGGRVEGLSTGARVWVYLASGMMETKITNLCECILLLWGEVDVAEEKGVVLCMEHDDEKGGIRFVVFV